MLRLRRILAVVIILMIVAVVGWIWFNRPLSPEDLLNTLPEDVDLALEDLHYTHNVDGQAEWTLDAVEAEYQREPGVADLNQVELTLYQNVDFGTVQLTADQGRYNQKMNLVDVWGNVTLYSERGDQLYTETLRYDVEKELLSTADPFRYLTQGTELTGTGLRVDVASGRISVSSDVRTRYNPQQGSAYE
jgi:LPS export ABC transporter protein LptC